MSIQRMLSYLLMAFIMTFLSASLKADLIPIMHYVFPNGGPIAGGIPVTVTGENLSNVTQIEITGNEGASQVFSFTAQSDTRINFILPPSPPTSTQRAGMAAQQCSLSLFIDNDIWYTSENHLQDLTYFNPSIPTESPVVTNVFPAGAPLDKLPPFVVIEGQNINVNGDVTVSFVTGTTGHLIGYDSVLVIQDLPSYLIAYLPPNLPTSNPTTFAVVVNTEEGISSVNFQSPATFSTVPAGSPAIYDFYPSPIEANSATTFTITGINFTPTNNNVFVNNALVLANASATPSSSVPGAEKIQFSNSTISSNPPFIFIPAFVQASSGLLSNVVYLMITNTQVASPSNFAGETLVDNNKHNYLLTWDESADPRVLRYELYRDGKLVGLFPRIQNVQHGLFPNRHYTFRDRYISLAHSTTYKLYAVSNTGNRSRPLSFIFPSL